MKKLLTSATLAVALSAGAAQAAPYLEKKVEALATFVIAHEVCRVDSRVAIRALAANIKLLGGFGDAELSRRVSRSVRKIYPTLDAGFCARAATIVTGG